MVKTIFSAIVVLCTFVSGAQALEWETLYEKGRWRLDLNLHDDGSLNCEARTSNNSGAVFFIESWDDGEMSVTFFNDNWDFGDEVVEEEFLIKIDRLSPWEISGSKAESSLWVWLENSGQSHKFLQEVYNGNALRLMNDNGVEIHRFSLSGSAATLIALAECADRIESKFDSSDPF